MESATHDDIRTATEAGYADLVASLRATFGDAIVAVVLFGSAARNEQRAVSDTNVCVVLRQISAPHMEASADALRVLRVALRLRLLVVCSDELPEVALRFTVKYSDILRNRRVLYGTDPFAGSVIPRAAAIGQVQQSLFNLALRLRESLMAGWDPARTVAELAGGLRACAAQLCELEGQPAATARAALIQCAGEPLHELSAAREGQLDAAAASRLRLKLLALTDAMRQRAARLA